MDLCQQSDVSAFSSSFVTGFLPRSKHLLISWLQFLGGSDSKVSACNEGDPGLIPGSGRTLKKEMATQYSNFAWKIPWMEEPGGLYCMGLQRVRHD